MVDVTDELVDDFLAHYGMKGMRWGVRKAEDDGSPRPRKHMTDEQKRKLKIAAGVAGTALVIGGIVATAIILNKNGKLPAISLPKPKIKLKPDQVPDGIKRVELNTLKPKTIDPSLITQKPSKPSKMDNAFKFVQLINEAKKGKEPAPKLDPEVEAFIKDSARRQAADNAEFKAKARKDLDEIEQDRFMLKYMEGSNPDALRRLREDAR